MLKKMQRRFILAVMLVFAAVMLLLIVGINLLNGYQMKLSQDKKMDSILEYDEMSRRLPKAERPPIHDMPWAGGEDAEFTTRFFIVHCDPAGYVTVFGNEYISSIDAEAAQQYTTAVLAAGHQKGSYMGYRYLVKEDEEELVLVFLNVEDASSFQRSLLLVSMLIGMGSLGIVFVLVLLLANLAAGPYKRALERQKRFITDASHELKTPITSIATSADIIAMEHEEDEWVRNIQKQTVRLTKLVNELVTLSRLDEEVPYPEKAEFSLSEAAWEIAEPFSALAEQKGKHFFIDIEEDITFYGEKEGIQQLLSILLDNAVRYSDEAGRIRLKIYRRRGKVVIESYNTWEYQENMELEHLFDRFYRPDESRSVHTGGSGIGLSIAQMITAAHGGRISVSAVERGALLFKVVL